MSHPLRHSRSYPEHAVLKNIEKGIETAANAGRLSKLITCHTEGRRATWMDISQMGSHEVGTLSDPGLSDP